MNWPSSRRALRFLRAAVVLVVGLTVVLLGVVLIVTPGPAFLVIPAGIAILATEFAWARRLLKRAKEEFTRRTGGKPPPTTTDPPDAPGPPALPPMPDAR